MYFQYHNSQSRKPRRKRWEDAARKNDQGLTVLEIGKVECEMILGGDSAAAQDCLASYVRQEPWLPGPAFNVVASHECFASVGTDVIRYTETGKGV